MKLWLVGQNKGDGRCEIQGIFDSKDAAKAACEKINYWLAPLNLNEALPDSTIEKWEGAYFPMQEQA